MYHHYLGLDGSFPGENESAVYFLVLFQSSSCHPAGIVEALKDACRVQGDLKRLLRSGSVPLTAVQRLRICYEASLALSHLSSQHVVHMDIAARNFLVSRSLSVKLTCVAAARGVDAGDYCELAGRLVPLRWLAPESALAGSYTSASDVWAYAIFVTEVSDHDDVSLRLSGAAVSH